jgi:glucokinase
MFLIGDLGGTKAHLALFDEDRLVKEEKFPSRHYSNFNEVLEKFLDGPVEKGCFAVAGPVRDQKCRMTNLSWEVDAVQIEKKHRISKINLINDLEASGWGLRRLKPGDIAVLNPGQARSGNQTLIAAGTGLGIAGLYWDGKAHYPFSSEGGHVDFSPRDDRDKQLWDYLHKKYGHVSAERVVSGPGLEHLYWFLVEKGKHKKILEGEEIPKLIVEQGLSGQSAVCQEALLWFAELYGAAAGNAALQFLSHGGVYLAGGIVPKILKILKQGGFMRAFIEKGRFKELLSQIPVYAVLNEDLPLLGALEYCLAH